MRFGPRSPIKCGSKPTPLTPSNTSLAFSPLLAKHFVTANDVFNARSRVSAAEAAVQAAHSDVAQGTKPARPVR